MQGDSTSHLPLCESPPLMERAILARAPPLAMPPSITAAAVPIKRRDAKLRQGRAASQRTLGSRRSLACFGARRIFPHTRSAARSCWLDARSAGRAVRCFSLPAASVSPLPAPLHFTGLYRL